MTSRHRMDLAAVKSKRDNADSKGSRRLVQSSVARALHLTDRDTGRQIDRQIDRHRET